MNKITSLLLAFIFCMTPFMMVSADPDTPGDDLIETSFSGIVTDSTTQEPIPDAYVYGYDDEFREFMSDVTDEEGRYYLEFNRGGHYTFYAECEGYDTATDDETVEMDSETTVDFALVPKVYDTRIYGIISDADTGEPLSDAYVQLDEVITTEDGGYHSFVQYTNTGDDGKYSFEVYEGTFQIYVSKEGYDYHISLDISVGAGDEVEYNVELAEWARGVFGVVYDENGDPFPGVTVSLETSGRRSWEFSTETDENGEYEIRVSRGGEFTLKAFMDGYRPYNQNIEVPGDSMVEQDIDMVKALLPDPLLRILYLILTILGIM